MQIIRMPLILLPVVLASATDALVALRRIGTFMRAEELSVPYEIDASAESAIDVDGDFTWETVRKDTNAVNLAAKFAKDKKSKGKDAKDKKSKGKDAGKKDRKKGKGDALLPTAANTPAGASPARSEEKVSAADGAGDVKQEEKPFALNGIKLSIPKGSFVAVVGRVGSGKVRSPSVTCFFLCRPLNVVIAELPASGAHRRDEEDSWTGLSSRCFDRTILLH